MFGSRSVLVQQELDRRVVRDEQFSSLFVACFWQRLPRTDGLATLSPGFFGSAVTGEPGWAEAIWSFRPRALESFRLSPFRRALAEAVVRPQVSGPVRPDVALPDWSVPRTV